MKARSKMVVVIDDDAAQGELILRNIQKVAPQCRALMVSKMSEAIGLTCRIDAFICDAGVIQGSCSFSGVSSLMAVHAAPLYITSSAGIDSSKLLAFDIRKSTGFDFGVISRDNDAQREALRKLFNN